MAEKRKAPGDAPRTSPPPARMRAASTDDEDVPHGGDPGSGGERKRVEGVPPRQHLPIAGMDANLTDNSGRIDSFARGDDNEPSSPSENEDELAVSEGKPQPPPPPPDQTVEEAEPPQPLPNDERMAMEDVPEPSRAENYDDCGDSPSYEWVLAATILASIRARMQRHIRGEPMDGALSFIEQEEVTSSLRPMSSSEQPSGVRSSSLRQRRHGRWHRGPLIITSTSPQRRRRSHCPATMSPSHRQRWWYQPPPLRTPTISAAHEPINPAERIQGAHHWPSISRVRS